MAFDTIIANGRLVTATDTYSADLAICGGKIEAMSQVHDAFPKKNLYFTTGNAGGIEVSYNGRPLPPLGTINEVKSLTFTSDGPHQ